MSTALIDPTPMPHDGASATAQIVAALTQAIVSHRLQPGAKLSEQTLANQFGVSRTLVRQALFQLSQQRLIRMEKARGAFVASPSVDEARQVFAVRRMLEAEMVRTLVRQITPRHIKTLQTHIKQEKAALRRDDTAERTKLLRDFHVRMAELMGNQVLAELLEALISRCSLITLMYQSTRAAEHSSEEHVAIVQALAAHDEPLALRLMDEHLQHVQAGLDFASPTTTPTS
jgi:DNA-binding GntR family transcriptional regulator